MIYSTENIPTNDFYQHFKIHHLEQRVNHEDHILHLKDPSLNVKA